jgi:hypothetical protein
MMLGEEDRLRGKVPPDLLIQVVQEVARVLPHYCSTSALDRADLAPTSPLTRRSQFSPFPLQAELDWYVALMLILLFGRIHYREDMPDLQGTSSRSRRREYARLEARLVLQAAGCLVEEDLGDCSKKLG